jgi:hypothetical protein
MQASTDHATLTTHILLLVVPDGWSVSLVRPAPHQAIVPVCWRAASRLYTLTCRSPSSSLGRRGRSTRSLPGRRILNTRVVLTCPRLDLLQITSRSCLLLHRIPQGKARSVSLCTHCQWRLTRTETTAPPVKSSSSSSVGSSADSVTFSSKLSNRCWSSSDARSCMQSIQSAGKASLMQHGGHACPRTLMLLTDIMASTALFHPFCMIACRSLFASSSLVSSA